MLTVLSPAKSLDYESPLATDKHSEPLLLDEAEKLVEIMATKSPRQLKNLMGISDDLAELNVDRFRTWERPFTTDTARPAVLAFDGDVYQGMDAANSFNQRDFTHAQKVVRILSGLYGVLRPLDLMLPYRLEMGTKLKTSSGNTLYAFWGPRIAEELNKAMVDSPGEAVLVNLASNEYFKAVDKSALEASIVTPVFLDAKGSGDYKTIAFWAKRARGAMAGWMVTNRAKTVDDLQGFDGLGYRFAPDRSEAGKLVFTRRHEA
jgi:cytoplasmic iron level regulating protein YaaA (DUF328/UPF0246 family)